MSGRTRPAPAARAEKTRAAAPVGGAGIALVAVYALSGVTSLAYEVLWARVLALQFGVSIFGVVAVVVAFMGGLGGGSLLGARLAPRIGHPLRVFAFLEAAIAAFALAMPWAFAAADDPLSALAARTTLTGWYLLLGAAAVLVLALPALAMGVGFPLALEAARGAGVTLDRLYGWNTLGGALGAMLPLALLPAYGWLASTQIVAAIGLVTAAAAFRLSRGGAALRAPPAQSPSAPLPRGTLLAYAGVGAASLMLEVGWTRLYGMVLLRTEYVLAVLLAVFLVGIGLGSLLARHFDRPGSLEVIPVAASVGAIVSLQLLPVVAGWADGASFGGLARTLLLQAAVLAAATLPVTVLLGMWLPLLATRVGRGAGARLYAVNSLGAAAGVLVAGVALIPTLGTAATTAIAAGLLLAAGLLWMEPRWRVPALALVLAGAWLSRDLPPVSRLLPRSLPASEDLFVHEDAITITHVVDRGDGERLLLDDLQRIDASTERSDVEGQKDQARLPLLLHPAPRSVLFLGLGTGISAAGSLPFPALDRHAVEISRGAIDAAGDWFAPVNDGVTERLTVVRDDAVRFLRADRARYDVIVGDLFHPDLAGRSALLSRQQFERARDRLAPGGVFVQWVALHQFDRPSLEVVMRTFARAFPEGSVFVSGFRLALVGGDRPAGAPELLANLSRMSGHAAALATGGEGPWSWLGRYWGPVDVGPGTIQDEWAPRIEFQLARARNAGELDYGEVTGFMLARRPSAATAAAALRIPVEHRREFERAYLATTFAQRAARLGAAPEADQLVLNAYELNPSDRWASGAVAERMLASYPTARQRGDTVRPLEEILRVLPDHPEVLEELWRLETARGRAEAAAGYLARLRRVAPLRRPSAGPVAPTYP